MRKRPGRRLVRRPGEIDAAVGDCRAGNAWVTATKPVSAIWTRGFVRTIDRPGADIDILRGNGRAVFGPGEETQLPGTVVAAKVHDIFGALYTAQREVICCREVSIAEW